MIKSLGFSIVSTSMMGRAIGEKLYSYLYLVGWLDEI